MSATARQMPSRWRPHESPAFFVSPHRGSGAGTRTRFSRVPAAPRAPAPAGSQRSDPRPPHGQLFCLGFCAPPRDFLSRAKFARGVATLSLARTIRSLSAMASEAPKSVPVTMLSGFLGAGARPASDPGVASSHPLGQARDSAATDLEGGVRATGSAAEAVRSFSRPAPRAARPRGGVGNPRANVSARSCLSSVVRRTQKADGTRGGWNGAGGEGRSGEIGPREVEGARRKGGRGRWGDPGGRGMHVIPRGVEPGPGGAGGG